MRQTPQNMKELLSRVKDKLHLKSLVIALSAIVVFTTTYLLILPAFTLDANEAAQQGGIDVVAVETAAETAAEEEAAPEAKSDAAEAAADDQKAEEKAETKTDAKSDESGKTEKAEKADKAEVKLLSKKTTITAEKAKDDDFAVSAVVGKDAKVPEDVTITAAELGNKTDEEKEIFAQYKKDALAALKEDSKDVKAIKSIKLYDISLESDSQEDSVEPSAPVNVKIAYEDGMKVDNADNIRIVHFAAQKNGEEKAVVLDATENKVETTTNASGSKVTEASFDTDGFSKYAVVEVEVETISGNYLTADGKTLTATVTYTKDAQIPEGATLEVKEVQEGDSNWGDRSSQFAKVLSDKYGNVTISDARFLDISIIAEGKEVEPKAPVELSIKYTESINTENTQNVFEDPELSEPIKPNGDGHFVMAHYTDKGAEFVESDIEKTSEGIIETTATTPAFSEYDVAYVYEYDAPEAGSSTGIGTIGSNYSPKSVNTMLAEAPALRAAAADGTPIISKDLADNNDGTYQLGLSVTGDAVTSSTSSPVNVVIVYDVSLSMTGNYVPSATGSKGIQYYSSFDGVSDGDYFDLYKRTGYNNYTRITDNEAYTGTVYRRSSGGYYTEYNGQRFHGSITRADAGEKVVYDFAHSLFGYQDSSNPSNIQASLVTFANDATITQGWTSTENDITRRVSNTGTSHIRTYSSATNWEAAMYQAYTLVNSADNDPTYVVFITDGQPTSSRQGGHYTGSDVSGSFSNTHYGRALNEARLVEQACANKKGALYSIYAYGKAADWLSSLTYYAYNGSRPGGGIEGTTFETEGYYNASDTSALTNAINEIFSKIVDTLGVGSASIHDGTTNAVQTTTGTIAELLDVDTDSFQYWLTIPVVGSGNRYTFSMIDKSTGDNVDYIATVSGDNVTISWNNGANSVTYKGKVNAGSLTLEWEAASKFYNFAPPSATFNDNTGAVDWNLNSLGTLLNNVTYTTTFNVYPSQYTLDLIADLKNGFVSYDSVDANIRKYILKQGDDYVLATNTGATLTYKDTRIDDRERTKDFVDPDPQGVSATKAISVSKDWSNILDWRDKPEKLTMHVTRDGTDRYELTLNDADNWTDDAWISYGIMTVKDGVVTPKTTGHDYSFSEPADMEYYWELQVPVIHPMYIEGVETLLVKVDEEEAPAMSGDNATATKDGETYYKLTINGKANYYKVDNSVASLVAENHRRSYLDVTKAVTGGTVPESVSFPFTMTVINSHFNNGTEDNLDSDYWVWFSVADSNNGYATVIDANLVTGSDVHRATNTSGEYTGYYYMKSGTSVNVNMKDGYSLRFLNLPADSTYTITEGDMPNDSYSFVKIEKTRQYKESKDGDWITDDSYTAQGNNQSITGTITESDSAYKVAVTNKVETIDVKLKKVKEDNTTLIGGSTFTLSSLSDTGSWESKGSFSPGAEATESTDAVPNPVDIGSLTVGRYKLTETKAPAGYIILSDDVFFEVYTDTSGNLALRLTDANGTPIDTADNASVSKDTNSWMVTVKNTPGNPLPNSGGIGTTIFYIFGSLLVIGCGIVLVSRRRMGSDK